LKDGDTLAKVLEQGLEEQYLPMKESIVKEFMSKRDKFKKEDLRIGPIGPLIYESLLYDVSRVC
jgi:hypothetical protein